MQGGPHPSVSPALLRGLRRLGGGAGFGGGPSPYTRQAGHGSAPTSSPAVETGRKKPVSFWQGQL